MVSERSPNLFLSACRCLPRERVPVWIMRQAGRYLPEYRALREKYSFLQVCKTPELAAEASLQPFLRLGVDAVIVFSDILIVAEGMGLPLDVPDSGPVLGNAVRDARGVEALRLFDPAQETAFLGSAIRLVRSALNGDIAVLGFAAAPWTLACYMVEGQARGDLANIRGMLYGEPALLRKLLDKIACTTTSYLKMQIEAGATAVQLFDTWAGELSREEYEAYALPAVRAVIVGLKNMGAPVILYVRGSTHLLESMVASGADVLSLDWRSDLAQARRRLGRVALQGNVDPAALLGPAEGVRRAARQAIEKTGGFGHILNLGHGILPGTPVENAQAFVETAKSTKLAVRDVAGTG